MPLVSNNCFTTIKHKIYPILYPFVLLLNNYPTIINNITSNS